MTDASVRLAAALAANGFPRMPASVLMALMVSETGALNAEELAVQLKASPAAISGAVRYLDQIGMVRRYRPHGDRRYVYELPEHAWYTVSISKSPLYTYVANLAAEAASELSGEAADRVREMADFFTFLEKRLPQVMAEWDELRRG